MATDLELAVTTLAAKSTIYEGYWSYYEGQQPVVYTNQRLKEIFRDVDAVFTQNWCAVVVSSVLERFNIQNVVVPSVKDAQTRLDSAFGEQFNLVADDTHEAMLVTGEAYVIIWPDENNQPRGYYNDPRMCHVFYDTLDPYVARMACKWFVNDAGQTELTLYYPDRLEHYFARRNDMAATPAAFEPMGEEPEPNPYGVVPVFQFKTHRTARSELVNVVPLQNGINKLLIDMMVAAEYGAFKQRYVISQVDPGNLRNAPNEIWMIPAGDGAGQGTQVGEFSAADLMIYLNAVDKLAGSIATISRTPQHYFFGQGGTPSGEALIAMEAPLNKKTADYISRVTPTWKQAIAFTLQLAGLRVTLADVAVQFEEPATVQPLTESQVRKTSVEAGIPLVTELRREGWSQEELDQMEEDKAAAKAEQTSMAQALLEQARAQFDQGQNPAARDMFGQEKERE